MLPAKKQSSFD